jgi:Ca-activated chloride channel family protein
VYPSIVPDLFVGRPVMLTGRFRGGIPENVRVTGGLGADQTRISVSVRRDSRAPASEDSALPSVWARMKIADLAARSLTESPRELNGQIKQLALDFNLMSAFTAFVAVDSATRTAGGPAARVPVAVPVPEGVNYEKTVQE